jgi:hypothetical protein
MSRAISSELISDKDVNGYAWPHNHKPPAQKLQCHPLVVLSKMSPEFILVLEPLITAAVRSSNGATHNMTRPQLILSFQHQRFQLVNTKAKMKETKRERGKKDRGKATPQRHFPCSLARRHGPIGRAIEPNKFSNIIPVANRDAKEVSATTNAAGRREHFHFVSKRYLLSLLIKS